MKRLRHLLLLLLALVLAACPAKAQERAQALKNPAEDFVRVSVVFAEPGRDVSSVYGHAMLRLECPDSKLDYIFSQENSTDSLFSFISGKTTVDTRAVPTQEYLQTYRDEKRSVYAYELNLPIRIKQRLWQQMDWRLEQPGEIYSPIHNSCTVSVMQWLVDAVDADSLEFAAWPELYNKSTRDLGGTYLKNRWVHLLCSILVPGTFVDKEESPTRKVLLPAELLRVLQNCKAYGKPLLSGKRQTLLSYPPQNMDYGDPASLGYWVKQPEFPATIILIFSLSGLLLDLLRRKKAHKARGPLVWTLITPALIVQTLSGGFVIYLLLFSDLPDTDWNWLVIPFNVLPLLLWRWREKWAVPFAAVCVLWCLAVTIPKYGMVDPTSLILALSSAAAFLPLRK